MEQNHCIGKKALVVGMGISGRSAAHFLMHKGAQVEAVDRNKEMLQSDREIAALKQAGLTVHLESGMLSLRRFDFIVVSPGIPLTHPLCLAARQAGIEILGEIELGCRMVQNPIIGITGTNGKTTAASLVAHVLSHSGKKARALGNIGIPFTKELLSADLDEWLILELSSYQLETLSQPVLDAAAILNITADHLDRYSSMQEYAAVKVSIEKGLKPGKPLYMEERAFKEYGHLLKLKPPVLTYGYSPSCFASIDSNHLIIEGKKEWLLPGGFQGKISHDLENMAAAYVLCRGCGISSIQFEKALNGFKKPPHRVEFVLKRKGVSYYDESKGTNVDAVIRAVQSIDGPIVLIAGGVDKGGSYVPWLESFMNKVKYICAIGQAAGKIQRQLSHDIPVKTYNDLDHAVKEAAEMAQDGDNVLLSPGCSSFDLFKDYKHRGEAFKKIVREL